MALFVQPNLKTVNAYLNPSAWSDEYTRPVWCCLHLLITLTVLGISAWFLHHCVGIGMTFMRM